MTTRRSSAEAGLRLIRGYFEARDALEAQKDAMLDWMLTHSVEHGATQREIAELADMRELMPARGPHDRTWSFHRTRVRQFLGEARERREMSQR